jgi:hypothetical protein
MIIITKTKEMKKMDPNYLPDDIKFVQLPYKSRNVKRLLERLKPKEILSEGKEKLFIWGLEERGVKYYCLVKGQKYNIEFINIIVKDRLSGLRSRLRIPRGTVDGKVVWEARWTGEFLVVNSLKCEKVMPLSKD